MKFKNAVILGQDFTFQKGGFTVENGVFSSFEETDEGIDLEGQYVIPGLIDVHFHGNSGEDFSVTDFEGLKRIASYLARNGVTSFAPASMTMPEEVLEKAYRNAAKFSAAAIEGTARIIGINMEGPFFSREKKGAQAEEYLMLPDVDMVERLNATSEGLLKIVCIAPELPGAIEFIEKISPRFTVSLAHTAADYDTAKKAIEAGAKQVTHLFNAMPPLLHRQPGVIGAAAEADQVMAELICDGVHVHESAVRAAFSVFSPDRIILISDALSCLGMAEGVYESGGQKIFMKNGAAVLSDGVTFAGSTTGLFEGMRRAISFGVKAEHAIKAASANPAKAVGAFDRVGSIAVGKQADFIICNKDFAMESCYIGGRKITG